MKKQITHAFKPRTRKSETAMLIFAGIDATGAGFISIAKVRDTLLSDFPDALAKFPEYESYFSIATITALFAGLLFVIFPMGFSAWLGRYLVGMSIAYLILGTFGIAADFPILFYVVYWMAIILPILSRLNTIKFYRKTTLIDFPIYLLFSACLLAFGLLEFLKIIMI